MKREIQVPITLKGAASFVKPNGDEVIDAMSSALSEVTSSAERMAKSFGSIMRNPMATEMKNAKQARSVLTRTFEKTAERIDRTFAMVETAMDQLRKSTEPKGPRDGVEGLYFAECRSALAKVPEAERGREIEKAIADGDDQFVAAALLGSARLTGLGAAQRTALTELYRKQRHPETVERIALISAAVKQLDRISALFRDWYSAIGKDFAGELESAEKAEAAAKEAAEAV